MERKDLVCASLVVGLIASLPPLARAQTAAPVPPTTVPDQQRTPAVLRVPALSVGFGAGVAYIPNLTAGPALAANVVARLTRHFALEGEVGHYQAERSHDSTNPGFGGQHSLATADVWYGAVTLTARIQRGRSLFWGGAGMAIGGDSGGLTITYTPCPFTFLQKESCTLRPDGDLTNPVGGIRFAGGVDVSIGHNLALFASAGSLGPHVVFQAGLRVAVRSINEVVK